VKPRKLTLRGFRSYRDHEPIEFKPEGLSALVGDTGAGKSSILQGMFYALYNSASWDARSVHELIADSDERLFVSLEFEANGDVWEATRSTNRKSGPPVHVLKCLSRPEPEVNGDDNVTRAVIKLLGMDRETFKAAVILPQDQFQQLLHARSSDRTKMLKSIFRLEELDRMGELTQNALADLQQPLLDAKTTRGQLLPDPAATEKAALGVRSQAADRLKALEAARKALDEAEKQLTSLQRSNDDAQAARQAIVIDAAALATLQAVATVALEIDRDTAAIDAERQTVGGQRDEHRAFLDAETKLGMGAQQLTELRTRVSGLQATLASIEEERVRLDDEAQTIATAEKDLAQSDRRIQQLQENRAAALSDRDDAQAAYNSADAALSEARQQLGKVREASKAVAARQSTLDGLRTALAPLTTTQSEAMKKEETAREALETATRSLEEARLADMAATLGEHLHAGDSCPVCAREVPSGFRAPTSPNLEGRRREQVTAKEAHDVALQTLELARDAAAHAEHRVQAAEGEVRSAQTALDEALQDLVKKVGTLPEPLPSDDEGVLGRLTTELQARKDRVAVTSQALGDLDSELTGLMGARKALAEPLDQRKEAHARSQQSLARRTDEAASIEEAVPAALRGGAQVRERIPDIVVAINERLNTLEGHAGKLTQLQAHLDELNTRETSLRARKQREVDEPHQTAVGKVVSLASAGAPGARLLARASGPARPEPVRLQSDVLWAQEVVSWTKGLQEALDAFLADCESNIQRVELDKIATLTKVGEADREALAKTIVDCKVDISSADRDIERARADGKVAAVLDPVIKEGEQLNRGLDELRKQLATAKFPGFVVEHRQRSMLRIASRQLAAMTSERYAFSQNFDILDQPTQQTRSPQTLSGGETFLASLSLALALVEMAGRSGGLVESLFLDEGFAALDANALDEALDALETHVAAGRAVTIVSHLRAIAERVPDLLLVTKDAMGSHARWVSGEERERLLEAELEAGLVA